ncbi:MAG TPA: hypothetical protein VGE35_02440 [Candidatus Paceibacterota bacterium]
MKNLPLSAIARVVLFVSFVALFAAPSWAFAHAGVEKQAGNVTVYLKQVPLSPLVGESVSFYFGLNDRKTGKALARMPIVLRVVDTFKGDESRDEVIFQKKYVTDANGNFDISYVFEKENHFDVEISLDDPYTKGRETTGFLVQARTGGAAGEASASAATAQGRNSELYPRWLPYSFDFRINKVL